MEKEKNGFPAHVRAFSELLIRLRAELGNDLDQVLILAIVAERHYAAKEDRAAGPKKESTAGSRPEECGINTHSVALYADMPRETVRRKVKALIEKGWLTCDARGHLAPTQQAAKDLSGGTTATLTYIKAIAGPKPQ